MKLWCIFDLPPKKTQISELEAESMAEDFWTDNRKAQAQMQQLNALREEVTQDLAAIEQEVEKLQFALMLNGEHDERDAIMSIHAGSGGVDAQDWAEMLFRM